MAKRKLSTTKCPFKGLDYANNTCYLDCVLFMLLALPSRYIENNILSASTDILAINLKLSKRIKLPHKSSKESMFQKFKTQLNEIRMFIRGETDTDVNITKLKKCMRYLVPQSFEDFYDNNQQDATEFLMYLQTLFNLNSAVKFRYTFGTNILDRNNNFEDATETSRSTEPIFIVQIPTEKIKKYTRKGMTTQYPIKIVDDSGELVNSNRLAYKEDEDTPVVYFQRRFDIGIISNNKEYPGNYLVINAARIGVESTGNILYHQTEIIPLESITLYEGKELFLSGLIYHQGVAKGELGNEMTCGHYLCIYNCDGVFYEYDDNPAGHHYKMKKIGDYAAMLKYRKGIASKNGILYFYQSAYDRS